MNLLDEVDKNGDTSPFWDCGYRNEVHKIKEDTKRGEYLVDATS